MERPGPVEVRRLVDGSVLVGTTDGLSIDAGVGAPELPSVQVFEAAGWADAGPLATHRVVDDGPRPTTPGRTGHEFVWLRLVAG